MAHAHRLRHMARSISIGTTKKGDRRLLLGKEFQTKMALVYVKTLEANRDKALELANVAYVYGKQLGSDGGKGQVIATLTQRGFRIDWVGRQIEYIEYGAGAPAVEHPYQGHMPSWYSPQAEGHAGGRYWFFRDQMIEGWRPYAPYYKTYLQWKSGKYNDIIKELFNAHVKEKKARLLPVSKTSPFTITIK